MPLQAQSARMQLGQQAGITADAGMDPIPGHPSDRNDDSSHSSRR